MSQNNKMVKITQIVKLVQLSQNDKPVQISDIGKLLKE